MKCVTGRDLPKEITSEEQAIFETLEMWYWLKENPDKDKDDYLLRNWYWGCALCNYNLYYLGEKCNSCFGEKSKLCDITRECAYYKWVKGISKKRNATKIYNVTKKYYFEKFGKVYNPIKTKKRKKKFLKFYNTCDILVILC